MAYDEIHAELRDRFLAAAPGNPVILGLPRRTRFRLWRHHQADLAGIWLCDHGRYRAAEWLWRLFRMW